MGQQDHVEIADHPAALAGSRYGRRPRRLCSGLGDPLRRIDPRAFPGKSIDELIALFGGSRMPAADDVVVIIGETDPLAALDHADCVLVDDPHGRSWGEALLDAAANCPRSRLDFLIKTDVSTPDGASESRSKSKAALTTMSTPE
jgi:hypothetical protein